MRKVSGAQFALFVLTISIIFSCAKSSPIGSDLLSGDQVNVQFSDTITMVMTTIKEDSVKAYEIASTTNTPFNFYPLGNFVDPVFGTVNASIYGQVRSSNTITADLTDAVLDSAVLTLAYNTGDFYGDLSTPQTVSIYRLTEDMDPTAFYYSSQTFMYDDLMPLATVNFIPSIDSVQTVSHLTGLTITSTPQLRVPLSSMIGNELLTEIQSIYGDESTSNFQKDSSFLDYFKGVHIRVEDPTNGIMNINLASGASALTLYFTSDTLKNTASFSFNSTVAKMTNLQHSFSPEVNAAFDNSPIGDTTLYLQALAGPNIEMKFPYVDQLGDIIINKAELEFTISVDSDENFPSTQQIVVTRRDDDGTYLFIEDVVFALNRANITVFGGQVVDAIGDNGEALKVYKLNISAAFQDKVDGLNNEALYVRIFPKQEQASRVKLFGPKHSQYPAKLNLTYTRLNN